ncbi:MAG: hypothetical protein EOP86_27895, partial [Verrucomicrobiaceae bacterium]
MSRIPHTVLCTWLLAGSVTAGESGKRPLSTATALDSGQAQPLSRNHFQISGGWMWRQVGDVRFVSGSRSGSAALPSLFGPSRLSDPPIGDARTYGDRRYADGYVGVDGGTANDGATSLWGYENASQVAGGAVSYHAQGSREAVGGGR